MLGLRICLTVSLSSVATIFRDNLRSYVKLFRRGVFESHADASPTDKKRKKHNRTNIVETDYDRLKTRNPVLSAWPVICCWEPVKCYFERFDRIIPKSRNVRVLQCQIMRHLFLTHRFIRFTVGIFFKNWFEFQSLVQSSEFELEEVKSKLRLRSWKWKQTRKCC